MLGKKLKKRFCKDSGTPIGVFDEPYFTDRLILMDKYFNCLEKYNVFQESVNKFDSDKEYLDYCDKVQRQMIDSIKSTEGYQRFNCLNMQEYAMNLKNRPSSNSIYNKNNIGKILISFDMVKGNFSSLKHFDKGIFNNKDSWEEFVMQFTDDENLIKSKYVRQVIMGNCNPKRQITYEKWITDSILDKLLGKYNIIFASNDEIVVEADDEPTTSESLIEIFEESPVLFKMTTFKLMKVGEGYLKMSVDGTKVLDFKCIDSLLMPFIVRKLKNQEPTESDKVFYCQNGLLAKLIETPDVTIER